MAWWAPSLLAALAAMFGVPAFLRALRGRGRSAATMLLVVTALSVGFVWPCRALVGMRPAVHHWDITHYYLGAKYFAEVGYDRLYDCLAIADREDGVSRRLSGEFLRNLHNDTFQPSVQLSPRRCKQRFAPQRWEAFKRDVRHFRELQPDDWARLKIDHGFTPTPMWTALARGFTAGPASDTRTILLVSLDLALLAAMWVLVFRTFGTVAGCLALVFWATNEPARFEWTFLAFLRHGWLAALVGGICMLRREKQAWAGVLVGLSALLRVFPGLVLPALGALEAWRMVRERSWRVSDPSRRFFAAAAITLAAGLVLSSMLAGRGWDSWPSYLDHARKYATTSMSNSIGLKTLTYVTGSANFDRIRRQVAQEEFRDEPPANASIANLRTWQGARARLFESRRPLYLALVVVVWTLAVVSARGRPAWVAALLFSASALITAELPGYYTALLLVLAFVSPRAPALGVSLLAVSALGRLSTLWFESESHAYVFMSALATILVASSFGLVGKRATGRER